MAVAPTMSMRSATRRGTLALAAMSLIACQHVAPAPLSAEQGAAALEARSLSDPGLRSFLERQLAISMPVARERACWPLASPQTRPAARSDGPMAIVILGGLATSTALNLLLLPVLCARYGRFERSEIASS